MKLIVETDLGRDPDDFFALCYFIDAGVHLQLITISPGDPDQVAVAKFILKECGLDIPVGVSDVNRNKRSVGSIHTELLKKYGYPEAVQSDGAGHEFMRKIWAKEWAEEV
jgi:inosine-uridine nucleoside N-ribohydrolase